ncbi:MAG TPA: hypothetical protein VHY37_08860 [Tepidisphaeraceae bacterium]|nr:hypothetical protein [Tepidisphaeraceae bacterium]
MAEGVEVHVQARGVFGGQERALFRFRSILGHLVRIQPGPASLGQVRVEHLHHQRRPGHVERWHMRHLVDQMLRQQFRHRRADRQRVLSTALGVGGGDGHGRIIAGQRDTSPRQAPQLPGPQPGFHRQPVKHSPIRSAHAESIWPGRGGVEQPSQFIGRQCPAIVPAVGFHVQPFQMGEGILDRPAILHHPPAELLHRRQVEIERLGADAPLDRFIGPAPIIP